MCTRAKALENAHSRCEIAPKAPLQALIQWGPGGVARIRAERDALCRWSSFPTRSCFTLREPRQRHSAVGSDVPGASPGPSPGCSHRCKALCKPTGPLPRPRFLASVRDPEHAAARVFSPLDETRFQGGATHRAGRSLGARRRLASRSRESQAGPGSSGELVASEPPPRWLLRGTRPPLSRRGRAPEALLHPPAQCP